MEDFSKASVTKNHKNSFDMMISSIVVELEEIKKSYYEIWHNINEDRKILADCVEHAIALTKKAGIVPPKNLDQFDRLELVDFMLENSYKYKAEDRDAIIEFARIIKERYLQIQVNVPKLKNLEEKLARYHVDEKDVEDEVELDLTIYRKKEKKEESQQETPQETELTRLLESAINLREDNVEYILIDIKTDVSLIELATKFYENPDYWMYIYDFKDNKRKLDMICDEYDIPLDEMAKRKGLLKGLSIKFPEEIKTFIVVSNSDKSRV